MPSFIPLGIPDFNGNIERDFFQFSYDIEDNYAEELIIQIRDGNKVWFEEKITDPSKLSQGEHFWKWDGFDSDGILDTAKLTNASSLNFYATVKDSDGNVDRSSTDFKANYEEVDWVDVKINRNSKRIDVSLRVNLKDGGANGTECKEQLVAPDPIILRDCPWDKIPAKDLINGKPPLKEPNRSFTELENLALDGLSYHWGRNKNHTEAKNVVIGEDIYEVFINAVNTKKNAMDDVSLIFNTNNNWMRSGNPGTVDDPISFIGNIVSREAICYNVGYIYEYFFKDSWDYQNNISEDIEFKYTSSHEIGHTILKAYGGTFYSYGHKGSVNTVTQSENSNAKKYPVKGEIDIMPYYKNTVPQNEYKRFCAAEKDVLGLIWLTKLELN
ncbi:hypothetical protein GCM10009117_02600 [Gangjinia marincola]|uniref:Uncharacterized protein n=1 Tax=Gangjinia marincola TaxID=578463 RepID=A0ABP3XP69_9FLAO